MQVLRRLSRSVPFQRFATNQQEWRGVCRSYSTALNGRLLHPQHRNLTQNFQHCEHNNIALARLSTTTGNVSQGVEEATNVSQGVEEATNVSQGVEEAKNVSATAEGSAKKSASTLKTNRGSPVSWASLALLVVTGAGLLVYFDREKKSRIEAIKKKDFEVTQGPVAGKAAIGGPFKLINHLGKTVTEKDFVGNWTLIYFGFTYCPDICPDELQKMVQALEKIEKKTGLKIQPLFITVDPERDTVEQMKEYVTEFHPRLVGLTGSADDVKQVAREYRVYYMKTEDEGSDYLVDHSIIMYLMDPDMEFLKFFGKNFDADTLAESIIQEIKNYKKQSK